ncbi:site-specific integrase [Lactococcus lactis]|uniref:Integrase n=1 Tax=Lactococcus lactis subsp. lactis TaxID=1360 RepID=A0A0V8EAB0_LACLL|nr:site-specific integrase [Lactococcus lactis]KSU22616.1 Integrase [Lactococcus lactis subsp. lactis]
MPLRVYHRGEKWEYRIKNSKGNHVVSKGGFMTEKEASVAGKEAELDYLKGTTFDNTSTLFDIYQKWYNLEILPSTRSKQTKLKYQQFSKKIDKFFNGKVASRIRHSEYQETMNLIGIEVGQDYLSRLNSSIREAIQLARRDFLNISDFTEGIKLHAQVPPKNIDDKFISSLSDYKKILSYLKLQMDYHESIMPYLIFILFKTGLRVGEALALTWNEINFEKQTIRTHKRIDSARHTDSGKPKTPYSVREIPVSTDVIQILIDLKNEQKKSNIIPLSQGLIFFDKRYGLPTNNGINKALKKYLKELNITPLIVATGCRHTYACVLLAKKVDISVVAKNMGHKNIQRIIDTYGHVLKELQEEENNTIRRVFENL